MSERLLGKCASCGLPVDTANYRMAYAGTVTTEGYYGTYQKPQGAWVHWTCPVWMGKKSEPSSGETLGGSVDGAMNYAPIVA